MKIIAVFLLILSAFSGALAQIEEDGVIRVETNLVVINAVLTDSNGKTLSNIKQNELEVYEDGKRQEITFFASQKTPFAAVILLDTSGSMESRLSVARAAAMNFLDGLRPDDMTAVYNFDSKVKEVQEFSNSRDIADRAYSLKADGMTVLNDAIVEAAAKLSQRTETRRSIVVLSDGADTQSKASSSKALKAALAANAVIYTIDMAQLDAPQSKRAQDIGVLKDFAEKTGGRFISAGGGTALRDAFKQIVEELGVQYTVGYEMPEGKTDGKWRAIELKISRPNIKIRARKGYFSPKK